MESVLKFILVYIIPILSLSVPIIALINAFIHRNDKEYTEVHYFIKRKDDNRTRKNNR
jgi:hypothetical protein